MLMYNASENGICEEKGVYKDDKVCKFKTERGDKGFSETFRINSCNLKLLFILLNKLIFNNLKEQIYEIE